MDVNAVLYLVSWFLFFRCQDYPLWFRDEQTCYDELQRRLKEEKISSGYCTFDMLTRPGEVR